MRMRLSVQSFRRYRYWLKAPMAGSLLHLHGVKFFVGCFIIGVNELPGFDSVNSQIRGPLLSLEKKQFQNEHTKITFVE